MTTSTERPVEPSRDARPPSAPRTARERARAEITAEILSAARRYLATDGAPALSLRAIARDLGMASSALYRYFGSRDELLTRLIVDAYDSLGAAAEASEAAVDRDDLPGRFAAVCRAVRTWALANPNEYALIYGSPVPGYVAPADTVGPATRVSILLMLILIEAAAQGRVPAEEPREARALDPVLAQLPPGFPGARPARADGVDRPVRRRLLRALRPAAPGRSRGPSRPRRLLRRVHRPLDHVRGPHLNGAERTAQVTTGR